MSEPVARLNDLQSFPMTPEGGSDRFGALVASFGERIGLKGLGMMYVQVEPGKRAFPFHNHLANDEAFVILEGRATYRFGDREIAVRAGDVCAAPHGGPETAHQLINTGDGPLRYIGISTQRDPEVVEYPESEKFAVLAVKPGTGFMNAHLRFVGRRKTSIDYWDGERT
ncbi:MAG: cupin domain-containing protein [Pseudomonadota bacterium]